MTRHAVDVLRPAGAADSVGGVPAHYVAAPDSTEAVAAVLRYATTHDLAVVVRGAGTRQDWAMPPRRLDIVLDTRALTGVVEHVAGDLVAVVRAGTPMADLRRRLAVAGQQLALDTPDPAATVGGTVATAASGPRRLLYGGVRDLLIGVTVVRADGIIAHAGGKVVKNVAGYDLGKLVTGSYGTLAVITECAFRLHPVPTATAYVSRRLDSVEAAGPVVAALLGSQVVPSALEIDAPAGGGVEVTVMLEGVPEGVSARVATARALLGGGAAATERAPDWWGAHPWPVGEREECSEAEPRSRERKAGSGEREECSEAEPRSRERKAGSGEREECSEAEPRSRELKAGSAGVGVKLTAALSRVPGLLVAARAAGERHGAIVSVRGSAGAGVLYAGLPGSTAPDAVAPVVAELRDAAHAAGGHAVVLTAPAGLRDGLDLWGPVPGLDLMRRVKRQFDPGDRLAPGRFVGGI